MSFNKYNHAVAIGRYTDRSSVNKFGRNPDVANGSWEPVVSSGVLTFPTAALAVRIAAGGNSNDTADGSGAREITVEGLDENWNLATETIATNGASVSSATSTTFIRLFRAFVSEVGSYGASSPAADISVENTGSTELIIIPQGDGQSQHAQYTIPAGKTGYLAKLEVAVAAPATTCDFRLFVRSGANNTADTFRASRVIWFRDRVSSDIADALAVPIKLDEHTDVWFEAYGNGQNAEAVAEFDIVLVDK